MTKLILDNLMLHIVDHCNLKCAHCGHFSNLASPYYLDIDWFEKQIVQMFELIKDTKRLLIMGGEPTLHPELQQFLIVAKRHYPNATVELWTNGILLEKQEESFWRLLHDLDIKLVVTNFPINVNKTKIRELVETFKVNLMFTPEMGEFLVLLNPKGDSDPKKAYTACEERRGCTQLYEGKVYLCARVAYVHIYNEYHGTQMEVVESDYVDIFSNNAKEKIEKYFEEHRLGKPLEFCKWCPEVVESIKWSKSEWR